MKKILLIVLCVVLLVSLASCGCKHEWEEATCEKPQTCSKCGKQQGEPKHQFSEEWTVTEDEHWHEAICGHTEFVQDRGNHSYGDYMCSVCGLWGKGPTGGYVFYDCDADNDETNDGAGPDGLQSSICGWRYLEVAPADLDGQYIFGYFRKSSGADGRVGTSSWFGSGKGNTEELVTAMGDSAYAYNYMNWVNGKTEKYAAKVCADYSITVDGVVYDDWFLPSKKELSLIYKNYNRYKDVLGSSFVNNHKGQAYWSSTEYADFAETWNEINNGGEYVWAFDCVSGEFDGFSRNSKLSILPIRAFK